MKRGLFFLAGLFFFGLFFQTSIASAQYGSGRYYDFSKRFRLKGDIQLTYEKRWITNSDVPDAGSFGRFTHSYNLGLEGYVIDPRLIFFDVNGLFTQEIEESEGISDTINTYGISTRFSLLNKPVRAGFFKNFPQPVQLRFDYYKSRDYKNLNYGVSLTYKPPERPLFIQQHQQQQRQRRQRQQSGQNGESPEKSDQDAAGPLPEEQGKKIPFPTFYLDYDKYRYTFADTTNDTDHLNLRAESLSQTAEYRAEYNYYRYGGTTSIKTQDLDVEANFRYYDNVTTRRLELFNRLFLTDYNGVKSLRLTNRTLWSKNFGQSLKDSVVLTGGGLFFTSEDTTNYNLDATGTYTRYFGERLRNTLIGGLSAGKNDEDTVYSVFFSNDMTYQLSRIFTLTNRALLGQNEIGGNFGIGVGLATKTVFSVAPSYDFTSLALNEGRTNTHSFNLNMTGRIINNLFFSSQNSYKITDVSGDEPFKEKLLNLRGDFFWYISRLTVNLGASHISVKRTDGDETESGITSLYSNLSTYLTRRAFLTLATTYQKDKNGEKALSIHPILNWYVRMVALTAEYEMIKRSGGERDGTEHRVFMRLTRYISKTMRPFW